MTLIYLLFIVAITFLFILAFQRQMGYYQALTPVLGWLSGLYFFIVIPLTLIIINGGYTRPGYPVLYPLVGKITTKPAEFLYPFLIIWVTLALMNLAIILFTPKIGTQNKHIGSGILSIRKLKRILIASIAISFGFFAINVYLGGGLTNYLSTHWYYRFNEFSQRLGLLFTLYLKLYQANQILLAGATGLLLVAALKKQWNNNYLLLFASVLTMVLHMVLSGNRIFIALLMIYLLAAMISFLDTKKLVKYALYLIPVVPVFSIWAYIRSNIGDLSTALQVYVTQINQASSKIVTTLMDLTEGTDSMLLVKVIRDFGESQPLLYGQTYIKAITSILPDSLGLSTQSFSIILGNIYLPGLNVSMNSTALGESWANFGAFTIFFIPLITLLIMSIGNWIYSHLGKHMLFNAVLFMIMVWMARSVFADNFQLIIISLMIIWVMGYEKNLYHLSTDN